MDFDQFMRSSSSSDVKTGAGPRRGTLLTRLPMQHGEVSCGEHTQNSLSPQYYLQISYCCDF